MDVTSCLDVLVPILQLRCKYDRFVLQAILPVLVGAARPAAEGGGFQSFPFHKLGRLSVNHKP